MCNCTIWACVLGANGKGSSPGHIFGDKREAFARGMVIAGNGNSELWDR